MADWTDKVGATAAAGSLIVGLGAIGLTLNQMSRQELERKSSIARFTVENYHLPCTQKPRAIAYLFDWYNLKDEEKEKSSNYYLSNCQDSADSEQVKNAFLALGSNEGKNEEGSLVIFSSDPGLSYYEDPFSAEFEVKLAYDTKLATRQSPPLVFKKGDFYSTALKFEGSIEEQQLTEIREKLNRKDAYITDLNKFCSGHGKSEDREIKNTSYLYKLYTC